MLVRRGPASMAASRLRAIHLYRHGLKNMLSWAVRREVFYAEVSARLGFNGVRQCRSGGCRGARPGQGACGVPAALAASSSGGSVGLCCPRLQLH